MYYQSINQLLKPVILFLFLLTIISCQSSPTEPIYEESNISSFQKDLRTPTTDVHGYVYKGGSTLQGATVKLYKGTTYLDQTTSDSNGYYEMCVCIHSAGTGTYLVKASYTDRFGLWTDTESFYYSTSTGPWDFEIDLYLILEDTK